MFLEAKDERRLYLILEQLENSDIKHAAFYEPDISNELTSIALMPSEESRDFCKKFKLAKYAPKARSEERPPLKGQVLEQYQVGALHPGDNGERENVGFIAKQSSDILGSERFEPSTGTTDG